MNTLTHLFLRKRGQVILTCLRGNTCSQSQGTYLGPSQTSVIDIFAVIVNISAKSSIIEVLQGSEYISVVIDSTLKITFAESYNKDNKTTIFDIRTTLWLSEITRSSWL